MNRSKALKYELRLHESINKVKQSKMNDLHFRNENYIDSNVLRVGLEILGEIAQENKTPYSKILFSLRRIFKAGTFQSLYTGTGGLRRIKSSISVCTADEEETYMDLARNLFEGIFYYFLYFH